MTTPAIREAAQQLLDATHHWQEVHRREPPMSDDPPYNPIDPDAWLAWADNESVPASKAKKAAVRHMQSLVADEVPTHPMNIEIYCAKWLDDA